MFKKIILSIIIGIFATIYYAQYDSWTHAKIVYYMNHIAQKSLEGIFSATIHSINFFSPSIVLHDLEMKSIDSNLWIWRCKKCEVTCSWLQLLFKGVLDQHIIVEDFECISDIKNSHLAIEPHLLAMMQQPFIFFTTELKSAVFKNAFFSVDDQAKKIKCTVSCNSSSLKIGQQIKTTMSLTDGEMTYQDNKYVEKIAMDISLVTGIGDITEASIQVAGTCMLSHMGNEGGCYVTGVWNGDRGRFALRNAYNSLVIDPIIITEREMRANAHFPLAYAVKCFSHPLGMQAIDGIVHASVKMNKDKANKIDGQLVVEDIKINHFNVCDVAKIIFERSDDDWKMCLAISRNNQECKGTGYWYEKEEKGEVSISNNTDLSTKAFNYWRIKPNHFIAKIVADKTNIQGDYQAMATNIFSTMQHSVKGSFDYDQGVFSTNCMIDADELVARAELHPEYSLQYCSYKDKEKKELIALQAGDDKKTVHGSIAFPFIRSLLNNVLSYDVQGEGNLDIVAHVHLPEVIADVALKDATIRLPQTYNFIDGFSAHCIYNAHKKSIVVENVNLSLHTGKVRCLRATHSFGENGSLAFMHAPFILDRCLLNVKKDLFAIVSGNILFSKHAPSPIQVKGHIFIDKAQLKENLFSSIIQKQLLSYTHSVFSVPDVPLDYDLSLETKAPVNVDTGFFQTDAHVNLKIKKEKQEPSVAGSIVLHSGILNFPYKPLYISTGTITFEPGQLFDPAIEFIARNKIKKYDVSLQIEGSLLTHHIVLDATPPLTEEQIVGLLLVGSEENSLNAMMPALIVQNFKSLIFSNNQLSFFDKYFKPLLGPLNINLVPSFTDQTGRGGLRGALEITVDDRWRAVIQKNFSLTEDTKFELEYLFSDDITFRAIRDERRDLGGEVEMRWKF